MFVRKFKSEWSSSSIIFKKKYTQQLNVLEFDEKNQKKYKLGCVYYIQEEKTNNVKIGWCRNLHKRVQWL